MSGKLSVLGVGGSVEHKVLADTTAVGGSLSGGGNSIPVHTPYTKCGVTAKVAAELCVRIG